MSGQTLTIDREMSYIVQWFSEWTDFQRDDFLPIFAEYLLKGSPVPYVNGIVSGLDLATSINKPMSLFQCRVKLFREWSAKWSDDLKYKLKEKLIEIDDTFGIRLEKELHVTTEPTVIDLPLNSHVGGDTLVA